MKCFPSYLETPIYHLLRKNWKNLKIIEIITIVSRKPKIFFAYLYLYEILVHLQKSFIGFIFNLRRLINLMLALFILNNAICKQYIYAIRLWSSIFIKINTCARNRDLCKIPFPHLARTFFSETMESEFNEFYYAINEIKNRYLG